MGRTGRLGRRAGQGLLLRAQLALRGPADGDDRGDGHCAAGGRLRLPDRPVGRAHHGVDGLLVRRRTSTRSPTPWPRMKDERLRAEMGVAAVLTAASYGPDAVHPRWEALFTELAGRPGRHEQRHPSGAAKRTARSDHHVQGAGAAIRLTGAAERGQDHHRPVSSPGTCRSAGHRVEVLDGGAIHRFCVRGARLSRAEPATPMCSASAWSPRCWRATASSPVVPVIAPYADSREGGAQTAQGRVGVAPVYLEVHVASPVEVWRKTGR